MIWRRENGEGNDSTATPVLGLSEKKTEWMISSKLTKDEVGEMEFFVEMACNTLFGAGKDGFINPPDEGRRFGVRKCSAAVKVRAGRYVTGVSVCDIHEHSWTFHELIQHSLT